MNEFQFRAFVKKLFANMKLNFAKLETDFLCEIEFRYGGNEFRSCKIESLFLAKLSCMLAIFNFVQAELTLISAKYRWKRYSSKQISAELFYSVLILYPVSTA